MRRRNQYNQCSTSPDLIQLDGSSDDRSYRVSLAVVLLLVTVVGLSLFAFVVKGSSHRSIGHGLCAHFCYANSNEEACVTPESWSTISCIPGVTNECGNSAGQSRQSPIALSSSDCVQRDSKINSNFNRGSCSFSDLVSTVNTLSNVQTNYPASCTRPSFVLDNSDKVIASVSWELVQFHIHQGSEHTLDGKRFDAELHLVHQSPDGKLLVIAILLTTNDKDGSKSDAKHVSVTLEPLLEAYKAIAENVASTCGESPSRRRGSREANKLEHSKLSIDVPNSWSPYDMISGDNLGAYSYMGSLTTPPCSSGVQWYVVDTPLVASSSKTSLLANLIGGKASPSWPSCNSNVPSRWSGSYRPIQSLANRKVFHVCNI